MTQETAKKLKAIAEKLDRLNKRISHNKAQIDTIIANEISDPALREVWHYVHNGDKWISEGLVRLNDFIKHKKIV